MITHNSINIRIQDKTTHTVALCKELTKVLFKADTPLTLPGLVFLHHSLRIKPVSY